LSYCIAMNGQKGCRYFGMQKMRLRSRNMTTREIIARLRLRPIYGTAGGWSLIRWKNCSRLQTTPLREALDRQSGMYRVAAKISDSQIDDLVAGFCRADGGCLRTILWKRDRDRAIASTKLPKQKFDPAYDQARVCSRGPVGDAHASHPPSLSYGVAGSEAATVPLLCQEACNLLVAECRKVVKGE